MRPSPCPRRCQTWISSTPAGSSDSTAKERRKWKTCWRSIRFLRINSTARFATIRWTNSMRSEAISLLARTSTNCPGSRCCTTMMMMRRTMTSRYLPDRATKCAWTIRISRTRLRSSYRSLLSPMTKQKSRTEWISRYFKVFCLLIASDLSSGAPTTSVCAASKLCGWQHWRHFRPWVRSGVLQSNATLDWSSTELVSCGWFCMIRSCISSNEKMQFVEDLFHI